MQTPRCLAMISLLCVSIGTLAQADEPKTQQWTVDGVQREALVSLPAKPSDAAPLLFVYHGHGGNMRAQSKRGFQEQWPEAIVVCPQGLTGTKTQQDPDGSRTGWQLRPGENDDRDFKFFDAMLDDFRKNQKIDEHRIYVTGHSNGAAMTYLLWIKRGKELAAIAATSIFSGPLMRGENDDVLAMPVLHIAGKTDQVVGFERQIQTLDIVRKIDHCDPDGKPSDFAKDMPNAETTISSSKDGPEVIQIVHPGGHELPKGATDVIVRFLKEQVRK